MCPCGYRGTHDPKICEFNPANSPKYDEVAIRRGRSATFQVTVDLDGVPGWGNVATEYHKAIQSLLDGALGHYNPVVTFVRCSDPAFESPRSLIASVSQTLKEPVSDPVEDWLQEREIGTPGFVS